MYLLFSWFKPWHNLLAWLIYLGCLGSMVYYLWRTKPVVSSANYAISAIMLALLWLMQVNIVAGSLKGMSYHLLGINLLTLILGMPLALLLASICFMVLGTLFYGVHDAIFSLAINILFIIMPAGLVNVFIRKVALRYLPKQVFIYIFINGFLAGAVGMLLVGIVICSVLQLFDIFLGSLVWQSIFPIFFLLAWGEAFLSGLITAVCVAFKPQLLSTFSDEIYLRQHNQIWK